MPAGLRGAHWLDREKHHKKHVDDPNHPHHYAHRGLACAALVLAIAALGVAIGAYFWPKINKLREEIKQLKGTGCFNTTCSEVEFRGIGDQQSEEDFFILSLLEVYDIQNGLASNNYDGSFFVAPITGIYHFDLDISLAIYSEGFVDLVVAIAHSYPNTTIIEFILETVQNPGFVSAMTLTGDMLVKSGEFISATVNAINIDFITVNFVNFNGHLVTEKIPSSLLSKTQRQNTTSSSTLPFFIKKKYENHEKLFHFNTFMNQTEQTMRATLKKKKF